MTRRQLWARVIGTLILSIGVTFLSLQSANAAIPQPPPGPQAPTITATSAVGSQIAAAPTANFSWTADFSVNLQSRSFSTGAGHVVINANIGCDGNVTMKYFYIQLWVNGSAIQGQIPYQCGVGTLQYTWTNVPAGTAHFNLLKQNDGDYSTGSGVTYYPSY